VLARHAEDLYWMGRYIERAEDTARLLDVTYHNMLEAAPGEATAGWGELLQVLFVDDTFGGDVTDSQAVTHYVVLDPDNAGSIRSSVRRGRHNARGLRDRISTELWESMNAFYLELNARDVRAELARQPYEVYRWVRNQCQLLSGVASETMPRDDGYRFLVLGRWLERAEMTCRLLSVRYKALGGTREMEYHWWAGLLSSVSAFEAYLKEHRASVDPARVLEFLLLSPGFPRSVLFCLRATELQLDALVPVDQRVAAQRLLGRVRAGVEYCDVEELVVVGLGEFLDHLQVDIWKVGEAIDAHFFRHGADLDLHAYMST
jgi:uncharacterized alpha-E superfamily protein